MKKILILYNIRSNHNVGSIFRTADACGIDKIYLVGYTPAPIDRFGREVGAISKVSLGTEKNILFEKVEDINTLLDSLKDIEIVSVEQSDDSIDYKEYRMTGDTAFILGEEVNGIPEEILKRSNKIIEVPMKGKKESLNVSVTAGVVLFRVLNI